LRALAAATNNAWSLEYRVRSYLAVNCAQCHQPGGLAVGTWDARASTPLVESGLINGTLLNNLGNPDNRVIKPGSLDLSVLLRRISMLGQEHMPPLATTVLNREAIDLVSAWITTDLTRYQSFPAWQQQRFGSIIAPEAAADADPDQDGASNSLEYLTGTDPLSGAEAWKVAIERTAQGTQLSIPQVANRGFTIEFSADLVDWFFLDIPANRPFFPANGSLVNILDPTVDGPIRFYRVGVFAP
jgi:mono/diheme cytochrome c family protein